MRTIIFQAQHEPGRPQGRMVNLLSTQNPQKRLIIRWTTLKGLAAMGAFLTIVTLIEYLVVIYAVSLGLEDHSLLQWNVQVPATDWSATLAISPLFHLVPLAVIITLTLSWTYLAKHEATKPTQTWKGKTGPIARQGKKTRLQRLSGKTKSALLKVKAIAYLWQKIHFTRAATKSAIVVIFTFSALILVVSLLAYPQLIYRTVSNAYQNNQSLLDFVKGTGQAFASIGSAFSAVNNALLSAAPGFRDVALGIGNSIKPLADLDNAGKYLVFQNVAAWISALVALSRSQFARKGFRAKIRGRS